VSATKPARLFVALELPAEAKSILTTWARRRLDAIGGLRVIDPAAMHLTLCFLGWRPVDEVDSIGAACRRLDDERALSVSLGGVLWLPRRRPGVVAIRLDGEDVDTGRLAALQSRLAGQLAALDVYRPERRPFLAHVTVARVRRSARVRAVELPAPEPDSFALRTLTLFRSYPGRGGSRYEPLASLPLRAAS
jgi:RNA 2',3'-cyclic 3'-phosphodiesterase